MKNSYRPAIWLLLAVAAIMPLAANGQDRMVVEWADNVGPVVNSLRNAILGDTTATGDRANPNRVYVLKRGGYYFLEETIENAGFHLRIEGETSPAADNPAVIQLLNRADGSNSGRLLAALGDVTLRNLIINGRTDLGNQPYEMVRFNGEGATVTIDNIIVEHAEWGILSVYGKNSKIRITNSTFRNLLSHTQPWGGRGISVWTDVDELTIENNTFFNIGAFAVQVEGGSAKYFWFNHNTVVNNGRQVLLVQNMQEAYVANNLIVNGFWHGEDETNFSTDRKQQADLAHAGIIAIDQLPSRYGLDASRRIAFVNNATYLDPAFAAYHQSGSGVTGSGVLPLRTQPFFNQRTRNYIDTWPNMVSEGHVDGVNPGLTRYNNAAPDVAAMVQNINDIRNAASVVGLYYYNPGRTVDPSDNITTMWPLPENLSYSNAQLRTAAVGGLPLGDLNWFPTQKASWQSQKATLEAQIKGRLGGQTIVTAVGSVEAETGVTSGGAAVASAADAWYAYMQGAGFIRYTANVATAGNYDLVFSVRSPFGQKKQRVFVNGTEAGNEAIDYTESTWGEVTVAGVTLNAGANTVEIRPSWGYQHFGNVRVLTAGTTTQVATLAADAATLDSVSLVCDDTNGNGSTECASGGQLVTLGTGSVAVGFSAPATGVYAIKIFANGTGVVNVSADGTSIASNLPISAGQADVYNVNLSAGNRQIAITGVSGDLAVDYVQFFQITTATGVDRGELPDGWALEQSYPNPFNPTTSIRYRLAAAGPVSLIVYDALGRHVATLLQDTMPAGTFEARWDGRAAGGAMASSGVYFYRLQTSVGQQVRSMVFMK